MTICIFNLLNIFYLNIYLIGRLLVEIAVGPLRQAQGALRQAQGTRQTATPFPLQQPLKKGSQ